MQQTKTETEQLQDNIYENLKTVRSKHKRHIMAMQKTGNNNVIMTLHTKESQQYDGFQSRPSEQIFSDVHNALKELDGDMHRTVFSEGTDSDAVIVETRPFNRNRTEGM